jgi:peptidoglycan hydrolase-like protein with peptidoglycan-binding domain
MLRKMLPSCLLLAMMLPGIAIADELTRIIQKDLIALGYDPGNIQGEATVETVVAISKFQAENDLEVTGEATPQLAGIIKARLKAKNNPGAASASAPAVAAAQTAGGQPMDEEALRKAQQDCLQEKVAAAQASKKKKRGFGSLMRAVANTATRYGGNELTREISETSRDVYDANATAQDWERAAEDLGLTTDDIEACRNPGR